MFRHEWADDELSGLLVSHNRNEVLIAEICTPERVCDVEDHLAIIGPRMGVSRARARDYCYIGLMFRRMPTLHRQARDRGHLPFRHLASIAVGTVAVDDEHIGDVEKDLLDYLAPSKDGLALPGIRSFNREICRIVDEHDPLARPIDEDDPAEERAARESVVIETDTANGLGHLNATLDKDRMAEFQELLAAERNRRIDLEGKCTWADALMGMARGEANPRIVMNVYRDINGGRAYLDGAAGSATSPPRNGRAAAPTRACPAIRASTATCPPPHSRRGSGAGTVSAASPGATCPRANATSTTSSPMTTTIPARADRPTRGICIAFVAATTTSRRRACGTW